MILRPREAGPQAPRGGRIVAAGPLAKAAASIGALLLMFSSAFAAEDARRITFLYDAFGPPSKLVKDWGFAAFIEYGGRRILFDTGNKAQIFANARHLGIDLTRLDAVVYRRA